LDSEIKQQFDGLRAETRGLAQEIAGLQTAFARETAGLQTAFARETAGLRTEIRSVADRGEEIKRSLGVLSESLRTDIRTVAEGFILTNERLDRFESRVYEEFGELKAMMRLSFADLDRRLQSR